MKIFRNFILVLLVVTIASSCYKEKDFWADNATDVNKSVPFVFMYALDSAGLFAGNKVRVLLEFYCKDPIKEIRLYQSPTSITGARTLVATEPYKPAYSSIRQMDTLVMSYTSPVGTAAGATVFLHGEVVSSKDIAKGTWQTTTSSRSFKTK